MHYIFSLIKRTYENTYSHMCTLLNHWKDHHPFLNTFLISLISSLSIPLRLDTALNLIPSGTSLLGISVNLPQCGHLVVMLNVVPILIVSSTYVADICSGPTKNSFPQPIPPLPYPVHLTLNFQGLVFSCPFFITVLSIGNLITKKLFSFTLILLLIIFKVNKIYIYLINL